MQSIVLLVVVVALWGSSVSGEIYFKKGAPHVKLTNNAQLSGKVQFSRDGRPYNAFKGIQYAQIPERFAAAEPVPAWEGIKSATEFGPICSQKVFGGKALEGEEDCLFLNVYVPMNNTGKRGYPVMVWVHGGAFVYGNGHGYGPDFFMDEDVILVTLNYRIGVFGFLSTGDEVIPGNNGLKDQVIALKWVNENIKQFGGDNGKVTIFGESAGGGSTHLLLLSPTTKGLFHRCISQSGSGLALWANNPNPKKSAVNLAKHLKCPTTAADHSGMTSEEILTCLKGLPSEELNKAQFEFDLMWPLNLIPIFFTPVKEVVPSDATKYTPFLTESPWEILSDKTKPLAEIPWMVGATKDEGATLFGGIVLSQEALMTDITNNWDTVVPNALLFENFFTPEENTVVAQKIKEFYFPGGKAVNLDTREALVNLYSDNLFSYPVMKAARETAGRGKRHPVYVYQYNYPGPIQMVGGPHMVEPESKMVAHADELQHLFTLKGMMPGLEADIIKPDTPDEEFSKNLVRLWVTFAIHGEPKHSWGENANRRWKEVSRKELDGTYPLRWFKIDSNPTSIDQPNPERMAFLEQLWNDHFSPAMLGTRQEKPSDKTEL